MTEERKPRNASDVLLDLEKKLDVALNLIRAQDLNIKIISNKLNMVMETLEKKSATPPKIMVEAVNNTAHPSIPQPPPQAFADPEKNIPISSEFNLPVENEPKGFRRTSRPETFQGDGSYLNKSPSIMTQQGESTTKFPVQIPKVGPNSPPPGRVAEVVVPPAPKTNGKAVPKQQVPKETTQVNNNSIPVMQRVVNGQGKSLFLADVEIIDLSTMQQAVKTRTNGTGKWMASLPVGAYRVIIRKLESLLPNQEKKMMEATQDIQVDGSTSPFELQTVIIKS